MLALSERLAEVCGDLSDNRGWTTHGASDPLAAWADLCVAERTLASRRSWKLHAGEDIALVVVEPSRWALLADLLSAARRYLPEARAWSWQDGALEPLGDHDGDDAARRPPGRPDGAGAEGRAHSPPAITEDEISMLLETDDDDASP